MHTSATKPPSSVAPEDGKSDKFDATRIIAEDSQVTIPKRVRDALGITPGSKVEFNVAGGGARLKLVKRHASSRIEEAAAVLDYKCPRIPVDQMHGGLAMKKAAKRVRH